MRTALFVVVLSVFGCGTQSVTSRPVEQATHSHAHGHSHDDHGHLHVHDANDGARAKMLRAESGATAAFLTAHLSSKQGNELDVYVERSGAPFALATQSITAHAKSKNQTARSVTFECAPLEERPISEPLDRCSHFVARVPWMQRDDVLEVAAELPIEKAKSAFVWREFGASRYAHHDE